MGSWESVPASGGGTGEAATKGRRFHQRPSTEKSGALEVSAIRSTRLIFGKWPGIISHRHERTENKQDWERNACLRTAIGLIRAYGEREDVKLLR